MSGVPQDLAPDASATDTPPRASGASPSQTELMAARIEREVFHIACGAVRDLRVIIGPESVLLTGRCGTYYVKQLAQTAAMSVALGARVINEIEVQ